MYKDSMSFSSSKSLFIIFIVAVFTLLVLYNTPRDISNYSMMILATTSSIIDEPSANPFLEDINFLVSSSKCKMSNLDAFNADAKKYFKKYSYHNCNKNRPLLTFTSVQNNTGYLHIDYKAMPLYDGGGKHKIECTYACIIRKYTKAKPDRTIEYSKYTPFNDSVSLPCDTIVVNCYTKDKKREKVYENVHAVIRIIPKAQEKIDNFKKNFENVTEPISVLFIGIDSISRLNLIRTMPKTYVHLENSGWHTLLGYNKMADNTFPNVMAIFSGMNQTLQYETCKPNDQVMDDCPMMWKDYNKYGYVTAYAEDEESISTFNYLKKGFNHTPTDYYLRPYVIASEYLKWEKFNGMYYCTGPETAGERILKIARDYARTFKDHLNFGYFWMNSFSHNELNSPSRLDGPVQQFLEDLGNDGVLDKSVVVFISDHGMRFGAIRLTYTGWLEERLPYIYLWFPPWFQKKFPNLVNNFKKNKHKLTSPYDLHMTLQHLFVLSGFNRTVVPSQGCPKCQSLLEEVSSERSCEDVGVTDHWCTCAGYKNIKLKASAQKSLDSFVVAAIDRILNEGGNETAHKCANYYVKRLISLSEAQKLAYKKDKVNHLLYKFETFPKAQFEATIAYKGDVNDGQFKDVVGEISRLDMYAPHSYCVSDTRMKKYCYCR